MAIQIQPIRRPSRSPLRYRWMPDDIVALRHFLLASQEEFAERLGTRQQRVSEWECAKHRPRGMSLVLLDTLAHEVGFDVRVGQLALTTNRQQR